jgi:hypothetical protein
MSMLPQAMILMPAEVLTTLFPALLGTVLDRNVEIFHVRKLDLKLLDHLDRFGTFEVAQ